MKVKFKQVDVFTSKSFKGNPVAVVFDADDLSAKKMQQIANWINLSETAFVQSSKIGDYKLRIFSKHCELPFAGHPTIGSAFALLQSKKIIPETNEIFQESNAGIVRLVVDNDIFFVQTPRIRILDTKLNSSEFEEAIGSYLVHKPVAIDAGPIWAVVRVNDRSDLIGLQVKSEKITRLSKKHNLLGVTVYSFGSQKRVYIRTFAPIVDVNEDPVCGSGNAAVAAHIKLKGEREFFGDGYIAYQGECLGREGEIHVRYESDDILIGGRSVLVIDGSIMI